MSSSHNLEKHARNEDSKLPRWLKIILTFIVLYFLWSSLPKVEVANEPMLMTDRELLEKVHELTSIEPLPSSYNSREKLLARFGKKLFFDKRLSLNNQVACSTCHDPEFSFSENKAQSTGLGLVSRNTPPIINLAQSSWFFWDGRADSLASQALGPLFHPKEMGLTPASFAKKIGLHHKKEYEALFGKFPKVIASLSNDHNFRLGEQDVMTLEMAAYGLATVSSFSVLDNILSDSSQKHMAPASLLAELSSGRSLDFKSHKPLDPKKQKNKTEIWTKKSNALEKVLLNTALSLEKFQKGLVANESPFDRFLRLLIDTRDVANSLHEEFKEEELDGLKIFLGQGNCSLRSS
jgi:cytochrome c peroxidase